MATDAVYKFMRIQNRPFSVNDIISNLHNEFGKPAIQKAVDTLVSNNKIFEKVYGKQKVYCVVQDSSYSTDELMKMDKELQTHANEVESKAQELDKQVRVLEAELSSLGSSLTLEEAKALKQELEESVNVLNLKLDELMTTIGNEDLTEKKRKAEKAFNEYSKAYSKRKRLCTDIIDCILENYPGSKNSLYEEIGIEPKIVQ